MRMLRAFRARHMCIRRAFEAWNPSISKKRRKIGTNDAFESYCRSMAAWIVRHAVELCGVVRKRMVLDFGPREVVGGDRFS